MAIRWIEIRLYAEGPVQSGYIRMVIRHFFYSVEFVLPCFYNINSYRFKLKIVLENSAIGMFLNYLIQPKNGTTEILI